MKKLVILLILLLILIIPACKSTQKNENKIILPPKPERMEIKPPETKKDYLEVFLYYEFLVQDWEQWGQTVEDIINGNRTD